MLTVHTQPRGVVASWGRWGCVAPALRSRFPGFPQLQVRPPPGPAGVPSQEVGALSAPLRLRLPLPTRTGGCASSAGPFLLQQRRSAPARSAQRLTHQRVAGSLPSPEQKAVNQCVSLSLHLSFLPPFLSLLKLILKN